jgi:hypothetical protein
VGDRARGDAARVVAHVPDLLDRSKVAAAFPGARFAGTAAELAGVEADLVLVDLARPGVLDVLPSVRARRVGFGSHVDDVLLDAARAAGCDEVLPRSVFFRRLAGGDL